MAEGLRSGCRLNCCAGYIPLRRLLSARGDVSSISTDAAAVVAPISGTLQSWNVADGDNVAVGDTLASMEAMKMEMQVTAHRAGRITLTVSVGSTVAAGIAIAKIVS